MTTAPDRLAYRVHEAADALGFSLPKTYALIKTKTIPSIRIGGALRVPVQALRAWIDAQLKEQSELPGFEETTE